MKQSKIIYLAGPYRAATEYDVYQNIQAARGWALAIWKLGAVCHCPHMNTAHFGGALLDSTLLAGDLLLLSRCDALFVMPNSEHSLGTQAEVRKAEILGLPVFRSLDMLEQWLKQEQVPA